MKKENKKNSSMFSKETLNSLEMAEVLGGDNNTNCSNTGCTNICQNTSGCSNDECLPNSDCTDGIDCFVTPPPENLWECMVALCLCINNKGCYHF